MDLVGSLKAQYHRNIWVFPKIGVGPPHHPFVYRVFHLNIYFHHPFWGTTILGNSHIKISKVMSPFGKMMKNGWKWQVDKLCVCLFFCCFIPIPWNHHQFGLEISRDTSARPISLRTPGFLWPSLRGASFPRPR